MERKKRGEDEREKRKLTKRNDHSMAVWFTKDRCIDSIETDSVLQDYPRIDALRYG